jgi:hypothetical protein
MPRKFVFGDDGVENLRCGKVAKAPAIASSFTIVPVVETNLNQSEVSAVEVKISTKASCACTPCDTSVLRRRFTVRYVRMTSRRQRNICANKDMP